MRRLCIVTLVLLLTSAGARSQNPPIVLHDGQQVTLTGSLVMEPAGRLQFVTVKTTSAYVPVFKGGPGAKDEAGEVLHEIGLAGYSDYALLYAHRGQGVTVTGRMATDGATPYFWHGTRLQVTSIRLAGGADLLPPRVVQPEPIAADTGTYQASVALPSDLAAPWVYSANGHPAGEGHFLSCSSNGGGDVMNCHCAVGFHAIQVESVRKGIRQKGDIVLDGMAQVEVGEDAAPPEVRITVTCSR